MAVRLGSECRQRRRAAGLTLLDIATAAGVGQTSIHEFEKGRGWRRETDAIVQGYADVLGTTPERLWRAALDREE